MGRANRGGACPIDVHQYIDSGYCQMSTLARTALVTMTMQGNGYLLPKAIDPMLEGIGLSAGGGTIGNPYRFAHMSLAI